MGAPAALHPRASDVTHSQAPTELTFAGRAGVADDATGPAILDAETADVLCAFFTAHPLVDVVQFELALTEDGDDLEFAGGLLLGVDGAPLVHGRDAQRAGEAFRRLLREPRIAALPIHLAVALEGIDHTFRIAREATGAPPGEGQRREGEDRETARERARLAARDERWDQRDEVRGGDDHGV
jgi:hypothetical protein